MLRWAADTAVGWKGCTKKLSAISRQLSVRSKALLARAGLFLLCRGKFAHIGKPPDFIGSDSCCDPSCGPTISLRTLFGGYCQWVLDAVRQTAERPISH